MKVLFLLVLMILMSCNGKVENSVNVHEQSQTSKNLFKVSSFNNSQLYNINICKEGSSNHGFYVSGTIKNSLVLEDGRNAAQLISQLFYFERNTRKLILVSKTAEGEFLNTHSSCPIKNKSTGVYFQVKKYATYKKDNISRFDDVEIKSNIYDGQSETHEPILIYKDDPLEGELHASRTYFGIDDLDYLDANVSGITADGNFLVLKYSSAQMELINIASNEKSRLSNDIGGGELAGGAWQIFDFKDEEIIFSSNSNDLEGYSSYSSWDTIKVYSLNYSNPVPDYDLVSLGFNRIPSTKRIHDAQYLTNGGILILAEAGGDFKIASSPGLDRTKQLYYYSEIGNVPKLVSMCSASTYQGDYDKFYAYDNAVFLVSQNHDRVWKIDVDGPQEDCREILNVGSSAGVQSRDIFVFQDSKIFQITQHTLNIELLKGYSVAVNRSEITEL